MLRPSTCCLHLIKRLSINHLLNYMLPAHLIKQDTIINKAHMVQHCLHFDMLLGIEVIRDILLSWNDGSEMLYLWACCRLCVSLSAIILYFAYSCWNFSFSFLLSFLLLLLSLRHYFIKVPFLGPAPTGASSLFFLMSCLASFL